MLGESITRASCSRGSDSRFLHDRVATLDNPRAASERPSQALRWASSGRYRVGDYRVIASIEARALCVLVVKIGNRREGYGQDKSAPLDFRGSDARNPAKAK